MTLYLAFLLAGVSIRPVPPGSAARKPYRPFGQSSSRGGCVQVKLCTLNIVFPFGVFTLSPRLRPSASPHRPTHPPRALSRPVSQPQSKWHKICSNDKLTTVNLSRCKTKLQFCPLLSLLSRSHWHTWVGMYTGEELKDIYPKQFLSKNMGKKLDIMWIVKMTQLFTFQCHSLFHPKCVSIPAWQVATIQATFKCKVHFVENQTWTEAVFFVAEMRWISGGWQSWSDQSWLEDVLRKRHKKWHCIASIPRLHTKSTLLWKPCFDTGNGSRTRKYWKILLPAASPSDGIITMLPTSFPESHFYCSLQMISRRALAWNIYWGFCFSTDNYLVEFGCSNSIISHLYSAKYSKVVH